MPSQEWEFYGRSDELAALEEVIGRGRWFFVKVSGRRRIGKTRLVQQALRPEQRGKVLYVQIPDSDPAGVVSTAWPSPRSSRRSSGRSYAGGDMCRRTW